MRSIVPALLAGLVLFAGCASAPQQTDSAATADQAHHLADLDAAQCDADSKPERTKFAAGTMPTEAAAQLERAEVVVYVIVAADGTARVDKVVKAPSPDLGLVQATKDAVAAWRYKPAMKAGQPVECAYTTRVSFVRPAAKKKFDPLGTTNR